MTLAEYIHSHMKTPFEWGKHDCVLFVVGWLDIESGKNNLEEFGTWGSMREAHRIVNAHGGLVKILDERLTPIHPNFARDGDITVHEKSMCIFSGGKIVGAGLKGLEFIDRGVAKCAWRY